ARQAHNLKVAGSNPAPATKYNNIKSNTYKPPSGGVSICASPLEALWKQTGRETSCIRTSLLRMCFADKPVER
ncbi:hypothetical protein, partial [Ruegeria lacuscaerulensis]|uniref:hypothetical protein n=1 Tax=Ruegeria lacuscaerulensis TaxID=55218 RepID=UPI001BE4BBC0